MIIYPFPILDSILVYYKRPCSFDRLAGHQESQIAGYLWIIFHVIELSLKELQWNRACNYPSSVKLLPQLVRVDYFIGVKLHHLYGSPRSGRLKWTNIWEHCHFWLRPSSSMNGLFRPSVRLPVCLSARHTFFTMFPSSYHPEIFRSYYQWQMWCPYKRSRSNV